MQAATSSGPRSIRAPSASSTSAEPDRPVAERLPCLAIGTPAPAATNAAVVDTLKVGRAAAGAGGVDETGRSVATGTARSRIARAMPAISPTVSPLARKAISKCRRLDLGRPALHDLVQDRRGLVHGQRLGRGRDGRSPR